MCTDTFIVVPPAYLPLKSFLSSAVTDMMMLLCSAIVGREFSRKECFVGDVLATGTFFDRNSIRCATNNRHVIPSDAPSEGDI